MVILMETGKFEEKLVGTVCSGVGRGGEVCKGEAKSLSKHYKCDKATGLQFLDFDKPPVKCSHLNVNREEFHFSQ